VILSQSGTVLFAEFQSITFTVSAPFVISLEPSAVAFVSATMEIGTISTRSPEQKSSPAPFPVYRTVKILFPMMIADKFRS